MTFLVDVSDCASYSNDVTVCVCNCLASYQNSNRQIAGYGMGRVGSLMVKGHRQRKRYMILIGVHEMLYCVCACV